MKRLLEIFTLPKGHAGSIRARKIRQSAKVFLLVCGITALVLTGWMIAHTRKNWLSVIAILTALPMANEAVVLIALLPYKGPDKKEQEEIMKLGEEIILDTELILTEKSGKPLPVRYLIVGEDKVFLMPDREKDIGRARDVVTRIFAPSEFSPGIEILKNVDAVRRTLKRPLPRREDCDEKLLRIEGYLRAASLS